MSFFSNRESETTLNCPKCNSKLFIARTCHEVFMFCKHCEKQYPLKDFVAQADSKMETFLENVYCDRM